MLIRNQNKVHGKHRGRSNFRLFTVTLYINTKYFSILLYFSFYFHTFRMLIKLTLYEKNYFFYYGNLYFFPLVK